MKRRVSLRTLLFVAAFMMSLSQVSFAQTSVSGTINADSTWTAAGSPYVLTDTVTVPDDVTLTIEPGAIVEFQGTNAADSLLIEGTLLAVGSAEQPIVFRPDESTVGSFIGLTFSTGSIGTVQYVQIVQCYQGIVITTPSQTNHLLDHLEIVDFAVQGIYASGLGSLIVTNSTIIGPGNDISNSSGISANRPDVTVENSWIRNSYYGLYTSSYAAPTVIGSIFSENRYGIYVNNNSSTYHENVTTKVEQSTFWNNASGHVYVRGYNTNSGYLQYIDVDGCVFGGPVYPVIGSNVYSWSIDNCVYEGPSLTSGLSNPTSATGNQNWNALLVNADADSETRTWEDFAPTDRSPARSVDPTDPSVTIGAVPYAGDLTGSGYHGFWYTDHTFDAGLVSDLTGDMIIAPGVTVTFLPGATIRAAALTDAMNGGIDHTRIEIVVQGNLEADGTESVPVVLTSAAAEPAPGDWYGIVIPSDAETFNVAQVNLSYGTRGVYLMSNDHVTAGSEISDCSEAGIYIEGGTPDVVGMDLHDNQLGIHVSSATVDIEDTNIWNSSDVGLYAYSSSINYDTGLIYDNGAEGIRGTTSSSNRSMRLEHVTLAHNSTYGIRLTGSTSYDYNLTMVSSSVTHNATYGISITNGDQTCEYSNVWGNGTSAFFRYGADDTCFSANPLYANVDNRNYEPTRHSPNRAMGENGTQVGALTYNGAPSPHIEGYLWDGYSFTEAGSPYPVIGDIVVPNGATVTFEAGATLEVAALSDDMQSGLDHDGTAPDADLISITFLEGAVMDFDATGETVMFTSDAEEPAPSDWVGIEVINGGGQVMRNFEVEYATRGLYLQGPSGPAVEDAIFYFNDDIGISAYEVRDTSDPPAAEIMAVRIIGDGDGRGLELRNAYANVRSSYITHTETGIYNNCVSSHATLWAINNTIVHQNVGINNYLSSSSPSYSVTAYMYNNIIAESSQYAVRAYNSSYSNTSEYLYNNIFFNRSNTYGAFETNVDLYTSDPFIEDDDWDDVPRWWDGKVWAESPAINQGDDSAPHLPDRDIVGNSRDIGGEGVDIGAFEHDPYANEEPRADGIPETMMVPTGEPFVLDGSEAFDPDGTIAAAWWTMSDETLTQGISAEHTFAEAGANQWAYLTVRDNDGAEDHARTIINVNDRPVANAGPAVFADIGEDVYFDGTESYDPDGSLAAYEWDFGDGSETSDEQSPTRDYASAGVYLVTLTVTDNEGLSHTDTTDATIYGTTDTVGPLVEHTIIDDGQPAGSPVSINATIRDTSGVDYAFLWYRPLGSTDGGLNEAMVNTSSNIWEATIPGTAVTTAGVEYWFQALDGLGNSSTEPSGAPTYDAYMFLVSGDETPPTMTHTEISDGQTPETAIAVNATVSDSSGVGDVTLYYRSVGESLFGETAMANTTGNNYTALIPAYLVTPPGVEYYIEASDAESIPNVGTLPADAPGSLLDFTVVAEDASAPVITHSPIADGQPMNLPVSVGVELSDSDGISEASVFYRVTGTDDWTEAAMTNSSGMSWSAAIPAQAVTTAGVDYYIEATDNAETTSMEPSTAPTGYHSFAVSSADLAGPAISHTPVTDGQTVGVGVIVSAAVTDGSGVASVVLYYRSADYPIWQGLPMTDDGNGTYQGTIPSSWVKENVDVYYYIEAVDTETNSSVSPVGASSEYHSFTTTAVDTTGPVISHTPVADGQESGSDVAVTANITDVSGILDASVFYRVSGTSDWTEAAMSFTAGDTYSATIPGTSVTTAGVDYTIEAVDDALAGNTSADPADAPASYHAFTVTAQDTAGPSVTHTPVSELIFGEGLTVTAVIADPAGVTSATLYYALDNGAFTSVAMTDSGGDGTYAGTVPASAIPSGTASVRYYVETVDALGNSSTEPEGGSSAPLTIPIDYPDVTPPTVAVSPISGTPVAGQDLTVTVTASDDESTVSTVIVYYRTSGTTAYASVGASGDGTTFTAVIPADDVETPGLDIYTEATDSENNTGTSDVVTVAVDPAPDLTAPSISVVSIPDGQEAGVAVTVQANVVDESGVSTVMLYYRESGGDSYTSLAMSIVTDSTYSVQIPAGTVTEPGVAFYVQAVDSAAASNTSVAPSTAPETPFSFTVTASDTAGPSLLNVPVSDTSEEGDMVDVTVNVSDPSGVASVVVHWRTTGETDFVGVTMSGTDGTYTASIGPASAPGIEYYIEATDTEGNVSTTPIDAPAGVTAVDVVVPDVDPPQIDHTEFTDGQEAGGAIPVQAAITDESALTSVVLYYRPMGSTGAFEEALMSNDIENTWSGIIAGTTVQAPGVEYYIEAVDAAGNTAVAPADAPNTLFDFAVGGDADTGTCEMPVTVTENTFFETGSTAGRQSAITNYGGNCEFTEQSSGDKVYAVAVAAGDDLSATITPSADFNPAFRLLSSCEEYVGCLGSVNVAGVGGEETLEYSAAEDGTIYIVVEGLPNGPTGDFDIQITVVGEPTGTDTDVPTETDPGDGTDTEIDTDMAQPTDTEAGSSDGNDVGSDNETDSETVLPLETDTDVPADSEVDTDTAVNTGSEAPSEVETSSGTNETAQESDTDTSLDTGAAASTDTTMDTADQMDTNVWDTDVDAGEDEDGSGSDGCSCNAVGAEKTSVINVIHLIMSVFR